MNLFNFKVSEIVGRGMLEKDNNVFYVTVDIENTEKQYIELEIEYFTVKGMNSIFIKDVDLDWQSVFVDEDFIKELIKKFILQNEGLRKDIFKVIENHIKIEKEIEDTAKQDLEYFRCRKQTMERMLDMWEDKLFNQKERFDDALLEYVDDFLVEERKELSENNFICHIEKISVIEKGIEAFKNKIVEYNKEIEKLKFKLCEVITDNSIN